jgi:hypothetical protein
MSLSTTKRIACWKCSLTPTNQWVCSDPACFYGVTPERAAEAVAGLDKIDKIIEEAERDA